MRRSLLVIFLCLLIGIIVNVVAAWTAVIREFDVSNVWQRTLTPDELERTAARFETLLPGMVTSGEAYETAGVDWYWLRSGSGRSWNTYETKAGWPLRTLTGSWTRPEFARGTRRSSGLLRINLPLVGYRDLPLHPLWLGFGANTLLYTLAVWLLMLGPWRLRRAIRTMRSQCQACGYPIGVSPVCTECGAAVKKDLRVHRT